MELETKSQGGGDGRREWNGGRGPGGWSLSQGQFEEPVSPWLIWKAGSWFVLCYCEHCCVVPCCAVARGLFCL